MDPWYYFSEEIRTCVCHGQRFEIWDRYNPHLTLDALHQPIDDLLRFGQTFNELDQLNSLDPERVLNSLGFKILKCGHVACNRFNKDHYRFWANNTNQPAIGQCGTCSPENIDEYKELEIPDRALINFLNDFEPPHEEFQRIAFNCGEDVPFFYPGELHNHNFLNSARLLNCGVAICHYCHTQLLQHLVNNNLENVQCCNRLRTNNEPICLGHTREQLERFDMEKTPYTLLKRLQDNRILDMINENNEAASTNNQPNNGNLPGNNGNLPGNNENLPGNNGNLPGNNGNNVQIDRGCFNAYFGDFY